MTARSLVAVALAALALALAACGGEAEPPATGPEAEEAWQALLADQGLVPAPELLSLEVSGEAPELTVTITVPADAPGELVFGDGLYGVVVYAYRDGAWERIDTADVRTEIAPILSPGQSATVSIGVEEAPSYRVLVPVQGQAVWVDAAP